MSQQLTPDSGSSNSGLPSPPVSPLSGRSTLNASGANPWNIELLSTTSEAETKSIPPPFHHRHRKSTIGSDTDSNKTPTGSYSVPSQSLQPHAQNNTHSHRFLSPSSAHRKPSSDTIDSVPTLTISHPDSPLSASSKSTFSSPLTDTLHSSNNFHDSNISAATESDAGGGTYPSIPVYPDIGRGNPFEERLASASQHTKEIAKWRKEAEAFVQNDAEYMRKEFQHLELYLQDMIVSHLLRVASAIVDHEQQNDGVETRETMVNSSTRVASGRGGASTPGRRHTTATRQSLHRTISSAHGTDSPAPPSTRPVTSASMVVPTTDSPLSREPDTPSCPPTTPLCNDDSLSSRRASPVEPPHSTHQNTPSPTLRLEHESIQIAIGERHPQEQYYMRLLSDLLLTLEPSKSLYLLARYISLRVIKRLFPRLRKHMQQVTQFPKDSVGRVTSLDYVCVQEQWSCKEALQYVHWLFHEQERRFQIMNQIIQDDEDHFRAYQEAASPSSTDEVNFDEMSKWESFLYSMELPFKYLDHKMGLHHMRKKRQRREAAHLFAQATEAMGYNEVQEKISDQRHVSVFYVTEPQTWKLIGVVPVMELMSYCMANDEKQIRDICQYNLPSISALEDREKTSMILKYYHMSEIPVVNKTNTLLSVVTVQKCLWVQQEEAAEDQLHQAGIGFIGSKKIHHLGPLILLMKRSTWLVVLVCVNLVSSNIIGAFQGTLERYIALSFFVPLLIGAGGNIGSQSATIIIRSMAMGEVTSKTLLKFFLRELIVVTGISLILAVVGFGIAIVRADWPIALVVSAAMFCISWVSDLLGFFLPFIIKAAHFDAAVATGPLITTILDCTGLLIYFGFATLFLEGFNWGENIEQG